MPRMLKLRAKFLSLVSQGANKMPVVYKAAKSGSQDITVRAISKFNEEQGELLNVAYAPELIDYDGDSAAAPVIKEAAYEHMRSGALLDLQHDGLEIPKDKAFVAESFIVQKGDPRFQNWTDYDGNPVDVTDAWATVIKLDDPQLRQLAREGKIGGTSIGGTAVFEAEPKAASHKPSWSERAKRFLGISKEQSTDQNEPDMDPKLLAEVVAKAVKGVLTETGLVKAAPPTDTPTTQPAAPATPEVDLNKATTEELEAIIAKRKQDALGGEFDLSQLNNPDYLRARLMKSRLQGVDLNSPQVLEKLLEKALAEGDKKTDEGKSVVGDIGGLSLVNKGLSATSIDEAFEMGRNIAKASRGEKVS